MLLLLLEDDGSSRDLLSWVVVRESISEEEEDMVEVRETVSLELLLELLELLLELFCSG